MPKIKPPLDKPLPSLPLPTSERRELTYQALVLARRANEGDLTMAAYLFELAALEIDPVFAKRHIGPNETNTRQ